jgi:hypothetical protein
VLTNEAMLAGLPPLLFSHLTRLQSLSIMKTSLAALPLSVSHLSALRILQLSSNRLTTLPHTIGTHRACRAVRVPRVLSCVCRVVSCVPWLMMIIA